MTDDIAIPAATVVLLRDEPVFEVLMVERREGMAFAGGALVFPGGRIDSGDGDPRWEEFATGLSASQSAAQIAAIREAFEETGILLARHRGSGGLLESEAAAALGDWRINVEKDDARFLEMARTQDLVMACDLLTLFAHWVAPPGLHRRFDTLFFAARCPRDQLAVADGGESTEALWIRPADAVAARARGERKMIFPTVRNVELLAASAACDDALSFARRRKIAPIMPEVVRRDGVAFLTIPSDFGYPVTEEPLDVVMRG